MYAVTPPGEWDAPNSIALRFQRLVDAPLPHAAWLREGDDLEHAAAQGSDGPLCGITSGAVYRHLFEDVATERRCPECNAEAERQATDCLT